MKIAIGCAIVAFLGIGAWLFTKGKLPFQPHAPYADIESIIDQIETPRVKELRGRYGNRPDNEIPAAVREEHGRETLRLINTELNRIVPPPISIDPSSLDWFEGGEVTNCRMVVSVWGGSLRFDARVRAKKSIKRFDFNSGTFVVKAYDSAEAIVDKDISASFKTDLSPGETGLIEFRVDGRQVKNVRRFVLSYESPKSLEDQIKRMK